MIGTIIWWTVEGSWPHQLLEFPQLGPPQLPIDVISFRKALPLYADLLFLYILTLSGLVFSLSALANLIREDGTTPRNRWIFIICGLATVISGLFGGPPILLSPESTAGIKAGARTGLSSIVCGVLFGLSVFFAPVLKAIPSAATSPVLIIVGVFLFQNVIRVDWTLIKDSVPAFCILFFIPFTFSVLQGVAMGYLVYLVISLATGDLFYDAKRFWHEISIESFVEDGGYEYLSESDCPSPPEISCPVEGDSSRSLFYDARSVGAQFSSRSLTYDAIPDEEKYPLQGDIDDRIRNTSEVERQKRPRGGLKKVNEGIPIKKPYRGYSDEEIRRISSPRRQSMDGLDHSVQVHSGVLEMSSSPSPNQMARSLPGGSVTLI